MSDYPWSQDSLLANKYPNAHLSAVTALEAAKDWVGQQWTAINERYGERMQTRMRIAFQRGLDGGSPTRVDSNFDKPLTLAWRMGRDLRDELLRRAAKARLEREFGR